MLETQNLMALAAAIFFGAGISWFSMTMLFARTVGNSVLDLKAPPRQWSLLEMIKEIVRLMNERPVEKTESDLLRFVPDQFVTQPELD